jgi:hypothetical protein
MNAIDVGMKEQSGVRGLERETRLQTPNSECVLYGIERYLLLSGGLFHNRKFDQIVKYELRHRSFSQSHRYRHRGLNVTVMPRDKWEEIESDAFMSIQSLVIRCQSQWQQF